MIFKRALRRELVSIAGAVFMTLFTITLTVMLIRILGQAAKGRVASADVIALIGFSALNYLPIILILTGFISVLMVVTRTYQDSEMVVWFASGLSLTDWVRPVLAFALPIVIVTGFLSFFATPWAYRQSAEYRERFQKREDISKVSPGRFQESASAKRVFFVEGDAQETGKVKNVFINSFKNGKNSIVVSKEGSMEIDAKGDRYLILESGQRYDGAPGQPDFRIMEFEKYTIFVAPKTNILLGDPTSRALPTLALLNNPSRLNMGELLWRISTPFMCLFLMMLAIPLGFVNPRAGRSANLIVALLLYVTYSNLVSFFQASVARGRMQFWNAWWPIHLTVALIIVGLFLWRLGVNSRYHPLVIWSSLRRRQIKKAEA